MVEQSYQPEDLINEDMA